LNDLFTYDFASRTWAAPTVGGDFPKPSHGALLVRQGDRLFSVGGCSEGSSEAPATLCYSDVLMLHTPSMQWHRVPVKNPVEEALKAEAAEKASRAAAAAASAASSSKNATNITVVDEVGRVTRLPDGRGIHHHPWGHNATLFRIMQADYQKAHNGSKLLVGRSEDSRKDAVAATGRRRARGCKGTVAGNFGKFKVQKIPCEARSQRETDAFMSPRYEVAGALQSAGRGDGILWVHGGCFLDFNCSAELLKLALPQTFNPAKAEFPAEQAPPPRSHHDPNTPEP